MSDPISNNGQSYSGPLAEHPLLLEAIACAAAKNRGWGAASIDPESNGLVEVSKTSDGILTPNEHMARWLRHRLRAAEASRLANGIPSIFLGERLIDWRPAASKTDYHSAPFFLTPVTYDDENRVFEVLGPQETNFELEAALATTKGKILFTDDEFTAVIVFPAHARAQMRIIDPEQNPEMSKAPAISRLLFNAPTRHEIIQDRTAELKAQRRTPLDIDQQKAYQAALDGHDLTIYGPPGTGKSEVIAEIARAALEGSKRVVIASTLPSALSVAKRRLDSTGHTRKYAENLAFETPDSFPNGACAAPMFDLLIVDEATRMTISEALLLATKARQLIVCGDPKQLGAPEGTPNLFQHACEIGLPQIMLRQHYRSKSGDLVFFSNLTAYDMQLRVVQSPDVALAHGVSLTIPAACSINRMPTGIVNETEARLVADKLAEYAAGDDPRSICVIAATPAQATAIRSALAARGLSEAQLTRNPDEPFFVRTVTQVQREERDRVLLSLTFAPQNNSMIGALGIIEKDGQPFQMLNVALTRARSRTDVFASFLPAHLGGPMPMSAARQAFLLFFQAYSAAAISSQAFDLLGLAERACSYIREPGDQLVNLGLLHAWKRPGSPSYNLGIVIRFRANPPEIWDIAIAQLKVAGWNLVVFDQAEIENIDIGPVQDIIEAAARDIRRKIA